MKKREATTCIFSLLALQLTLEKSDFGVGVGMSWPRLKMPVGVESGAGNSGAFPFANLKQWIEGRLETSQYQKEVCRITNVNKVGYVVRELCLDMESFENKRVTLDIYVYTG
jgi:hypothetical protein